MSTAEDPANPVGELVSTEQLLGLNYLTFAMNPLRLDGIEPWALGGQQTRHYPDPMAAGFDLAVVGGDPASHLMAFMPGGVVPDKKQSLLAPLLEPVATPPKKPCGYGAHRPTVHEPQPGLFELRQIKPVTGERAFGSGSSFLASFSRRRTGFVASDQECREGRSKRENQVSSSKPTAHCGWLSARRISRSRAPFFERIPDPGSRSSAWPAPSALPAAKA